MMNRGPNGEPLPKSRIIALLIIRFLQITCLTLLLMILADVFILMLRTGPPPVPLDPEGRQYAPYTDYPYPGS
jgi:hypothetical protein